MNLRAQRTTKVARIEELTKANAAGTITEAQLSELETLAGEVEKLNEQIAAEDRRAAVAERAARVVSAPIAPAPRAPADPATPATQTPAVATAARGKDPRRGFVSLAEFAALVVAFGTAGEAHNALKDERFRDVVVAATGTVGAPSDGGAALPPAFSTELWGGPSMAGLDLSSLCDRRTVQGESLTLLAVDETSRKAVSAGGSRGGGFEAGWRQELGTMSRESKLKLREVKIEPHELYVFVPVTDKLLRNNPIGLEQELLARGRAEIMFRLNAAIMAGTGAGQPLGIMRSGALISVAKTSGQAADTITKANVDAMFSRLAASHRSRAIWTINQDCEPEVENLSAIVGNGGVPVYLPPGGYTEAPNARLKGRPIFPTEFNETLGDLGDIVFADFGAYLLGTRGTEETAASMHLRFDQAQTVFRIRFEADGQPWVNAPLTPYKGTTTVSPFVALAARA